MAADVLIVCVREDEPQAKALAEMFEAAGFTIGGAPSNDAALRASGAGVIVWSQASIRSRPFLDAAQRVINAGKAVVASLIEPPPASSIGDSPAFDLGQWDGDPNDPSLDPLFFAVDRMVNAARATVGAATAPIADPQSYEPTPAPRTSVRAAIPLQPAARGQNADHLGAEAEYWRAIRDSRNPSDFMDYIARYGPDGAFSEVAELRLKQLTAGERSRSAPARPTAAMPATRPPPRAEPPMREAPPRRLDTPPRRLDAAPPPRRPSYERAPERADLRDPPRGEGGVLRAVVLVALLGAALAGGLYFGGGLDFASAPRQDEAVTAAATTPTSDEPASADGLEPESYSFTEAATAPPRRETARPATAPSPTQRAEEEEEGALPAPVTSWASSAESGGPTSLAPPSSSQSAPGGVVSLAPPAAEETTQLASVEPETLSAPARAGAVTWAQRPSARRIADLYPQRAARESRGGRVQLDCTVSANLAVACTVANETPAGLGFGRAALQAAASYRAQPWLSNGESAVGARTRISVSFQP